MKDLGIIHFNSSESVSRVVDFESETVTDTYTTIGKKKVLSVSFDEFFDEIEEQCAMLAEDYDFTEDRVKDAIERYWSDASKSVELKNDKFIFRFDEDACFHSYFGNDFFKRRSED